jgi:diguanylate cyclase (GGDEF)-like protein/putative nucleotidyltransferase with HDIG domain
MDLDGFKLFNDTYGHPSGDDALRQVADLLSSTARDTDIVGRYGGDEFMAILTDTDGGAAVRFCERLRAGLAKHPYESAGGDSIPLHLSFGVASFPADGHELNELIALADASLYTSKQSGGDKITVPSEEDDSSLPNSGMFSVLDGLVTTVDAKDRYTRHHSEDVTTVALKLVQQLELSDETQRTVRVAGLLHDVGKIGVPDRILRKPGRLTEVEFEVVKQHALLSEVIIKEIPNLNEVVEAVGSHHERWDGNGYPRGLKGKAIPFLGRVLAIADAWSAMTTDRPYRSMMTTAEAREEILQNSGSQFDPALVEAFVAGLDEDRMAAAAEQAEESVR